MKIGNIDGTPKEIRDLFEGSNLQLTDYIEAPLQPSPKRWIIAPAVLFAVVLGLVIAVPGLSTRWVLGLLVLGLACDGWLAVALHLSFRNQVVTWMVLTLGLVLLLMSSGILLPKDALDVLLKHKSE